MGFTLKDYSEKAVLLTGDTKQHRDELKKMYGKWIPKKEGWAFSKKRRVQLEEWIEDNTVLVVAAPEEFFSDRESSECPDSDSEDIESDYNQLLTIRCNGRTVGVYQTLCYDDDVMMIHDTRRFKRMVKDDFHSEKNNGNGYFRITTSGGVATWSTYDGDLNYALGIKIPTTVGLCGEEWDVSKMVRYLNHRKVGNFSFELYAMIPGLDAKNIENFGSEIVAFLNSSTPYTDVISYLEGEWFENEKTDFEPPLSEVEFLRLSIVEQLKMMSPIA
jgi:hypothetical protein